MSLESEFNKVPDPPCNNTAFLRVATAKNGDVGAVMNNDDFPDDPKYLLGEAGCYKYLHKSTQWHSCPVVPDVWREFHKTEADIMHKALASIQAEKLSRNIPLDKPLTPHPDVEMKLPGLKAVEPEI